jgi:hypothetical protein
MVRLSRNITGIDAVSCELRAKSYEQRVFSIGPLWMKRAFFMNTNTLGQTRTVRPKSRPYPYFRVSFILFVQFLSQSA